MERICIQCHTVLASETQSEGRPDWCPACGGKLIERPAPSQPGDSSKSPLHAMAVVDHRGIVLPPRHAVGGIITPQ